MAFALSLQAGWEEMGQSGGRKKKLSANAHQVPSVVGETVDSFNKGEKRGNFL